MSEQLGSRLQGKAVELGFELGWKLMAQLPEQAAQSLFARLADRAHSRRGPSIRQLERNLLRVCPQLSQLELTELSRDAMRSDLRYYCEAFRLPTYSSAEIEARNVVAGSNVLFDAVNSGRGTVVSMPHSGNWDLLGAWAVGRGVPFTTVVERLKPEGLYRRFVEFRESIGMEVLPLTGGAEPVFDTLAARLRAGGTVCLLGDRDISRSGVRVSFFGETARMPAGPAALAIDTGANLLSGWQWYRPDGPGGSTRLHTQLVGPIEPAAGSSRARRIIATTQLLADQYAIGIAEHPADWHMLQPLWLADLDPRRVAAGSSASPDGSS